ncbi:MAG: hypothetical protein M3291_01410 [Actinomycetota bacterium]|nr:hypothetical protein [Actinomycetota bacterium]
MSAHTGAPVAGRGPGQFVLSGCVLTHPARGDAASRLAAQGPPGALSVVTDPLPSGPPTVLRTALAAWEAIPLSATHHLIVQDDMLLSAALFDRARLAIEARPQAAHALFSVWDSRNSGAVRLGALSGARWVASVNEYTPCAALILPRAVAAGYVSYVRNHPWTWPDDIMMFRYLRSENVPCLIAVPNLAEHGDAPSIVGNGFRGPRRSACFLRSDRGGSEDRTRTDLSVVPFFKNGRAQCVVRLDRSQPPRWLHLETADLLSGSGVPDRDLAPRLGRLTEGLDPQTLLGTWLTAYALGRQTPDAGPDVDPAVVTEALRTIAVGGMSHYAPARHGSDADEALTTVARLAVEEGRSTVPRTRHTAIRLRILGGDGPLGEHVVRLLADRGHAVTVVSSQPPSGTQPGVRYLVTRSLTTERDGDAVVDLRRLEDAQTTAAGRTIVIRPGGPGHSAVHIDVGHLYGPGCGPGSVIGAMVWAALQSEPIEIADRAPDVVRPRHVRELADLVLAVLGGHEVTPPSEYPIGELAEIITLVRPTPVRDLRTAAHPPVRPAPGQRPDGDLRFRLHHFSQWLAYEYIPTDPVTIT